MERQDKPCEYLAYHKLESVTATVTIMIIVRNCVCCCRLLRHIHSGTCMVSYLKSCDS